MTGPRVPAIPAHSPAAFRAAVDAIRAERMERDALEAQARVEPIRLDAFRRTGRRVAEIEGALARLQSDLAAARAHLRALQR